MCPATAGADSGAAPGGADVGVGAGEVADVAVAAVEVTVSKRVKNNMIH